MSLLFLQKQQINTNRSKTTTPGTRISSPGNGVKSPATPRGFARDSPCACLRPSFGCPTCAAPRAPGARTAAPPFAACARAWRRCVRRCVRRRVRRRGRAPRRRAAGARCMCRSRGRRGRASRGPPGRSGLLYIGLVRSFGALQTRTVHAIKWISLFKIN
jgi:hypothetical protein